jgi:sec-independent protein translocase protein TatC
MGIFDHLEELRGHLYRAVVGLVVGMLISLAFANQIILYIASSAAASKIQLQAIAPTETVSVYFRVVLMVGAILSSPWITYQLLSFITPGLTRQEKSILWKAIPFTTLLFIFGVIFTWFVLMPAYISWLAGFQAEAIKAQWTAEYYFGFVTQVLFWHGAVFETPVIVYVIARLGILNANQLLNYWRHALLLASLFSGFVAPTYDVVMMLIVMGLLFGLYMLSILFVIIGIPGSYVRGR